MAVWLACDESANNCRRTFQDPRPSNGRAGQVTIGSAVGVGGANVRADVVEIQKGLNRVPVQQGGPVSPLVVDGWCGQLTISSIRRFQEIQFPSWHPDGRIDPGQKTIQRLNALQTGPAAPSAGGEVEVRGVELAYSSIPETLARVNRAIVRLSSVRPSFLFPTPFFPAERELRLAEWHFKVHRAPDPVAQIDRVLAVYDRMRGMLSGALLSRLFQEARPDTTEVAHTYFGGYEFKPDELGPRSDEPGAYIYIQPKGQARGLVIIHELGHYCGGREGSGREIDHMATPLPPPRGRALERGVRNYADMTPNDALRNTHSFQAYAFPEQVFGRVPENV